MQIIQKNKFIFHATFQTPICDDTEILKISRHYSYTLAILQRDYQSLHVNKIAFSGP